MSAYPVEQPDRLILLGVGQLGLHVGRANLNYQMSGTTRNKHRLTDLTNACINPVYLKPNFVQEQVDQLSRLVTASNVLVSFPPDEKSDQFFSNLCQRSKTVVYISSTSVYGRNCGVIDESSKVDTNYEHSKPRLKAENSWLNCGAIVLRTPAIYGPQTGLHLRLKSGTYKLPINSDNYISRIHLQDLTRIILALFTEPLPPQSIRLVGDLYPAPQKEVVNWLCQTMNIPLPLPASEDVHYTLTSNRQVNARKILSELGLTLQFPSYKEGYKHCLGL